MEGGTGLTVLMNIGKGLSRSTPGTVAVANPRRFARASYARARCLRGVKLRPRRRAGLSACRGRGRAARGKRAVA
eukprot:1061378-Prymnesium_polylepis.1